MSLASQLLDYSSDEDEDVQLSDVESVNEQDKQDKNEDIDLHNVEVNLTTIEDITIVSKLKQQLEPTILKIEGLQQSGTGFDYEFIKHISGLTQQISSEMAIVHNYIKIHYNSIFVELDSLVPKAVDYARTVKVLGNNITENVAEKEEKLKLILPKEKILVINMSASLKQSDYETPLDITNILKACDLVIDLDHYQKTIMQYIASNLQLYAPNLSKLIGTTTTAQLISALGSLQILLTTPSCNLALLGNKSQSGIGYSGGVKLHGYLYDNELIQNVPDEFQKQLLRMFSAKITLCARIDMSKSAPDGSLGQKYKEEVLEKLDKLMQGPQQLKTKLLPVPIDQKSKKRGGKRFSKMKKNFETSDLQKLQNKMSFGEREESYIDAFGNEIGLGMAARSNNGSLRLMNGNTNSGAKAKMSKSLANKVKQVSTTLVEDDLLSFDNPDLQEKKKKAITGTGDWFNDTSLQRKRLTDDLESRILKKLKNK